MSSLCSVLNNYENQCCNYNLISVKNLLLDVIFCLEVSSIMAVEVNYEVFGNVKILI